jgi:transposase
MTCSTILPDPGALRLEGIVSSGNDVVLVVRPVAEEAGCPAGGNRSPRVHSWYVRRVTDLPWPGVPVRLRVRRFICTNDACPRRIFTERVAGVVATYGRQTVQREAWLRSIAFALSGRPAARLLRDLGVALGQDALLARVRTDLCRTDRCPGS